MADIIKTTQKNVKKYLKEIYGRHYDAMVQEVDGSFIVRRGTAAVHVKVKPLSKDDCIVQAQSYVVQGAKIGPKLLTHLMRLNANNPIGAFGLGFDDTITFHHSITGANLDANELRVTVATVAFVADEHDEEIVKLAGGTRAVDGNFLGGGEIPFPFKKTKAVKKTPARTPAGKKKLRK